MVTYGFYDSINGDRKYNAIQFGSIFDGIVRDGIFMSIGDCFRVRQGEGMMVLVGIGRAWFNHTWTLNDALLPVYIPQSEVILHRIDAVVIDVDATQSSRKNSIIVVKGTPSSNPQRPNMIHTAYRNQYPLAYIYVQAGTTSIRTADISSAVGTSEAPYVTGILETVNIDALLDQWKDQWQAFYEKQTAEIENYNDFWEKEWQKWYEAQTAEIRAAYLAWQSEWTLWSTQYKNMMEETAEEWKSLWNAWFYTYINQNQQAITEWQQNWDNEIRTWFDSLQDLLDDNVAASLSALIIELKNRVDILDNFKANLTGEHAVYDTVMDKGWIDQDNIIDSESEDVLDSVQNVVNGRPESSYPILDSSGNPIISKVIFAVV